MNSGPTLQLGSMGPDVRRLQILFVMTKLLDYTGIDGNFGPQTQDAVKSFQQMGTFGPRTESAVRAYQTDRGVAADGVVGDQTRWIQQAQPAERWRHWQASSQCRARVIVRLHSG